MLFRPFGHSIDGARAVLCSETEDITLPLGEIIAFLALH
jgi:hypothetical protein